MSLGLARRFPLQLTFADDPSAKELQQVVGPDFTTARVVWNEDDERIVVRPPELPFRRLVAAVLVMLVAMSAAPWGVSYVSNRPYELSNVHAVIYCLLWLVVGPVGIGVLVWARRASARIGPGVVIDKRTRELSLPWIERTVPAERIERFVDVRGRCHFRGTAAFFRQCGVVFRDDTGGYVFAPFARLSAPGMQKSCAARIADFYDLPLQEQTGVVFALS